MKGSGWAARVAILGSALAALGAVGASSAFAGGSPTYTTLGSSQNPSPACGSVTLTATVYGALFPDSPVGFVQFFDGASALGAPQLITYDFDPDPVLGAHVVPTNHSSGSISVVLSGGTHVITAVYAGADLPSTGGPFVQTITAASSTTTVTSSANPSVFGQPVVLAAGVASSCTGSVAGSIQFHADGSDLGGPQPVDGSGHASLTATTLAAGTHAIDAVFSSGNSDVAGSSGSLAGGQIVDPAQTTTAVSSSANQSEFGAAVTLTAATTVDTPGSSTPGGSVQFQDNGIDLGPPESIGSDGRASITISGLAVEATRSRPPSRATARTSPGAPATPPRSSTKHARHSPTTAQPMRTSTIQPSSPPG